MRRCFAIQIYKRKIRIVTLKNNLSRKLFTFPHLFLRFSFHFRRVRYMVLFILFEIKVFILHTLVCSHIRKTYGFENRRFSKETSFPSLSFHFQETLQTSVLKRKPQFSFFSFHLFLRFSFHFRHRNLVRAFLAFDIERPLPFLLSIT